MQAHISHWLLGCLKCISNSTLHSHFSPSPQEHLPPRGSIKFSGIILIFSLILITIHLPPNPSILNPPVSLHSTCQATTPISHLDHCSGALLKLSAYSLFTTHRQINYLCKMVSLSWLNTQGLHSTSKIKSTCYMGWQSSLLDGPLPPPSPAPQIVPYPPTPVTWPSSSSQRRKAPPTQGFAPADSSAWSTHGSFCHPALVSNPTA